MNFSEYVETDRLIYKEFSKVVRKLLKQKIYQTEYNLHTIQSRAKTEASLKEKLAKRNLLSSSEIENEIKDLAGCRIIFYLDSDVHKFISSRLIDDVFNVVTETYKVHHPKDDIQSSNDFYMADHFVVELHDNLSSTLEYSKFRGLRCEIQVCTILNHAYSEMNHKIYKKPEVTGFATEEFKKIEKRLISLAENHIIQAGYEFQKIYDDIQRLSVGKSIYDRPILKEVSSTINNHERYNLLNQFRKFTLPHYDDINREFTEIINIVRSSLQAAKSSENIIFDTSYGSFPGKSNLDVFSECIEILDYVRYVNPENIFTEYLEIYDDPDCLDKKLVLSKIKNLADFNYKILEKAGYFVQSCLCLYISHFDSSMMLKFKSIIIEVCKSIFKPGFERTIFDYNTVTFADGNLPGSSTLLAIRNQAIVILKHLSTLSKKDSEKYEIFLVLTSAMRTPSIRDYDDKFLLIILGNCFDITTYYLDTASNLSFEILSLIESSFLSTYKIAKSITKQRGVSEDVLKKTKILISKLLEFGKNINKNTQYIVYKTLIGHRSVFSQEWTRSNFSFEQKNHYRSNAVNKFIASINAKKEEYWVNIIIRCSKIESSDMSVFSHFIQFLQLLGKLKPEFAYKLISVKHNELSDNICYLIVGLIESDRKEATLKLISKWISEGKYLAQLVWVHRRTKTLGKDLLVQVVSKAIEVKDDFTLKHLISSVIENLDNQNKILIKTVIIPCIINLTKNRDSTWVSAGLINPHKTDVFFDAIDESDIAVILDNLVYVNSIDYSAELVLLPIANRYPDKLIAYFGKRLLHQPIDRGRYDRLPYSLDRLREPLANHVNLILDASIIWYQDNPNDFMHKGARFIKLIFPNFNKSLEQSILTLLHNNFDLYLPVILSILGNYSGEIFLYDTCKIIVALLPDGSQFLSEIQSIMLGQSSLISTRGEFGLASFYKDKRIQIQTWVNDSDPKIKQFSQKLLQRIENSIGLEKRRAEQDIARRKRE